MIELVADTSGLVSLGVAADHDPDPLGLCLSISDVRVPIPVVEELDEIAEYDDAHGRAAEIVLDRIDDLTTEAVRLDPEFPLDAGENAGVTLANEVDADLFLCDEFNRLGLIHASLATTRLVTTPTLLAVFVRRGQLATDETLTLLEEISTARSWEANSYVTRARSLFSDG